MTDLCIRGMLDITAFFNISGNILWPKFCLIVIYLTISLTSSKANFIMILA